MSVRWQHCIDYADKHSKAGIFTRLSSRRSSAADRQSVKRDCHAERFVDSVKDPMVHGH